MLFMSLSIDLVIDCKDLKGSKLTSKTIYGFIELNYDLNLLEVFHSFFLQMEVSIFFSSLTACIILKRVKKIHVYMCMRRNSAKKSLLDL